MKKEYETQRVLRTLFALHHEIMVAVTSDDTLGTVGKEFLGDVGVAESTANVLALKISKKGK